MALDTLKFSKINTLLFLVFIHRAILAAPMGLISQVPANNALNVPIDASIVVKFDQSINPATINGNTFTVDGSMSGWHATHFIVVNDTVTFTPTKPFQFGETVQITLTQNIQSINAASLVKPKVWQFTTVALPGPADFSQVQSLGNASSRSVALGDINNDGYLDALTTNTNIPLYSNNQVWQNNSWGNFSMDTNQDLSSLKSFDVVLGDMDRNHYIDAFITNEIGDMDQVWINNASGSLVNNSFLYTAPPNSAGVALGDVDGDGDLDAVIADKGTTVDIVLRRNDGMANFSHLTNISGGHKIYDVALGDIDNDNDLDIITANNSAAPNQTWLNNGTGVFMFGTNLGSGSSSAVALGDIDGDGDLDALFANHVANVASTVANKVWKNNGNGHFTAVQDLGSNSVDVALGDVDGDGDLDAFFANPGSPNKLWLNAGNGTFFDSGQDLDGSSQTWGVTLGDIDDDGDLDVFFANEGANKVHWNGTTAMRVVSKVPPDNATDVPTDITVAVTFNREVKTSSIDNTSFLVTGSLSGQQTGTFDTMGKRVTFAADNLFQAGEIVTVTLSQTIAHTAEDTLYQPQSWQFPIVALTPLIDKEEESTKENKEAADISSSKLLPLTMNLSIALRGSGQGQVKTWPAGTACKTTEARCTYRYDTTTWVTLVPEAASGSQFVAWGGDPHCQGTRLFMDDNYTCVAYFERLYPLTVTTSGQGEVSHTAIHCGKQCVARFAQDTPVKLTAYAAPGWQLQAWQGDCDQQGQVVMTGVKRCQAHFVPFSSTSTLSPSTMTYTLTLNKQGEGLVTSSPSGVLCGTTCTFAYPEDTLISLIATPAEQFYFAGFSGACDAAGQVISHTDQTCTATFLPISLNQSIEATAQLESDTADTIISPPASDTASHTTDTGHGVPMAIDESQSLLTEQISADEEPLPPCDLTKGAFIDTICNAQGQRAEDITIGPDGKVSNVILAGTINNQGWLSNCTLEENSHIIGGILTGYVENRGWITAIEFRGQALTGGTLAGTIRNTSTVTGVLTDIHLTADAHLVGGQVAGTVIGEGTTFLETLEIAAGTYLKRLILAEDVKLNAGIHFGEAVVLRGISDPKTLTPKTSALLQAEQVAQIPADVFATLQPEQLAQLSAAALDGMTTAQFQLLPLTTLTGITSDNIGGLPTPVVQTLTPEHLQAFDAQALSGLQAEQLAQFSEETLASLTTTQFAYLMPAALSQLNSIRLSALSLSIIHALTPAHLEALATTAFTELPSKKLSEMLIHLDAEHITPEIAEKLLPTDWQVDLATGTLIPPAGTQLTLKMKTASENLPSEVKLPALPDLETSFSVGGRGTTVREGMRHSLAQENLKDFVLSQDDKGILNVEGTGEAKDIRYAFIPDVDNMIQVDGEDIPIGLSQDEGGFYLITTPDKQQFKVIPAPHDPVALSTVIGDGHVNLGQRGDVLLAYPEDTRRARAVQRISVIMFDPFIEPPPDEFCMALADEAFECDFENAPENLRPGVHFNPGNRKSSHPVTTGYVVYPNGTSQRIRPTVLSPDTFIEKGLAFNGVEKLVYNANGTFTALYRGQRYMIYFDFNVNVRDLVPGESVNPRILSDNKGKLRYEMLAKPSKQSPVQQVLSFDPFIEQMPEEFF
jgi:hypothetical protein